MVWRIQQNGASSPAAELHESSVHICCRSTIGRRMRSTITRFRCCSSFCGFVKLLSIPFLSGFVLMPPRGCAWHDPRLVCIQPALALNDGQRAPPITPRRLQRPDQRSYWLASSCTHHWRRSAIVLYQRPPESRRFTSSQRIAHHSGSIGSTPKAREMMSPELVPVLSGRLFTCRAPPQMEPPNCPARRHAVIV